MKYNDSFLKIWKQAAKIYNNPAYKTMQQYQNQLFIMQSQVCAINPELYELANKIHSMHKSALSPELRQNINFVLSQSPAFELQRKICDVVSPLGLKAVQVPSFEKLPKETRRMIQTESIAAEEKCTIIKHRPSVKVRHKLIAKARKESTNVQKDSLRAKVADWITIISGLIWLYAYVNDPDFRQTIFDKTELLVGYVEYLQEILQTMNRLN